MKRILLIIALLAAFPAWGQAVHSRQYGVATTVPFVLYNSDGTLDTDEADGGTEVSLGCDEGAESTATNDFVDEGTTYSIALTATELECARLTIVIAATDTNVAIVETYGDLNSSDPARGAASGTAQSGTASTIVLDATTNIANDLINNRVICLTGGTGAGQCRLIDDWVSSTDTVTVSSNWTTNPASGTEYIVLAGNQASAASLATTLSETILDTDCSTYNTVDDVGYQLCTQINAILTDTGTTLDNKINTINTNSSNRIIATETADSGTATTLVDADSLGSTDDIYNNGASLIVNFSGGLEERCVRDFDQATDTITVYPPFNQAVSTENYILLTNPSCRTFP